jgi:hypothetical protein
VRIGRLTETFCLFVKDEVVIEGVATFLVTDIRYVLRRLRLQRDTALEFILSNGVSHLVDFAPRPGSMILKRLEGAPIVQTSSFRTFFRKRGSTPAWVEGRLSTFEYLLQLNLFASRSFRDASIYPIFPWVLSDFDSFDLADAARFRDFRFPILAQTEQQRCELRATFNEERPADAENAMFFVAPSNPTVVAFWLGRLPPFSLLGSAESAFPDLRTAFVDQIISGRTCELVPEFFCQPEALSGAQMPQWTATPLEFVYLHRKALECEWVSAHIHEWIDLVFGISQCSSASCNAVNPQLGSDVWEYAKESDREMLEEQLARSGQLPPPLFDSPHPARAVVSNCRLRATISAAVPGNFGAVVSGNEREARFICGGDGRLFLAIVGLGRDAGMKTITIGDFAAESCWGHGAGGLLIIGECALFVRERCEPCGFPPEQIAAIAGSNSTVVMLGESGVIWRAELRDLSESEAICSVFYERPSGLAVCGEFDMLVVITIEGSVLLYRLSDGAFRVRCQAGGELPERVLVTEGWGFIAAATAEAVWLMTVNGDLVRRSVLPGVISAWCTWRNAKGFDFIAMADEKGCVFVCEAFYLDFREPVAFCRGAVADLAWVREAEALAAVRKDGTCFVIPISVGD